MNSLGRVVREVLSWVPALGLAPRPGRRPQGISAMVRVKNEDAWIEPCVRSVQAAVDELVVVDNGSTDRTPELLTRLAKAFAPKLRVFWKPELDHVALSNFAMDQTRFRWVLKWDGDFVAHTDGPHAIAGLRERLLRVPPARHHHIALTCVELMGDLHHQCPGWETRTDPFVATYAPALRFIRVVKTMPRHELSTWPSILRNLDEPVTFAFEALRVPLSYRLAAWPEPYFFHVQVKSPVRMYVRDCWSDWAENPTLQRTFQNLEAYALDRARRAWGVGTLEEAAEAYMTRLRAMLIPYSIERFGPPPALLRPLLS